LKKPDILDFTTSSYARQNNLDSGPFSDQEAIVKEVKKQPSSSVLESLDVF
jgi:transcription antitermination factor NusG